MNGWYVLIPAIAGLMGATAAWLKAHTATQKLNDHLNSRADIPPPR